MKRLTIILIAIISIGWLSCTKHSSGSNNTCRCEFIWYGRDTTIYFNYYNVPPDSSAHACDYKNKWVLSLVGPGSGGCRLMN